MCPGCVLPWLILILSFFGINAQQWFNDNPLLAFTIVIASAVGILWSFWKLFKYYKDKSCNTEQ